MADPNGAAAEQLAERTRIINATADEIRAILRQASDDVARILAAQPSDYQRWYLPQLQQQINAALARYGDEAAQQAGADQRSTWSAGAQLTDKVLQAAEIRLALPVIDDAQLQAMTSFLTTKIKGITLEAANAINTQLGLVIIGSQTPWDAIKAVQVQLEEKTTSRARMIVNTELGRAYSTANQARQTQAAQHVPGLSKKWLKSGKVHPRINHVAIDGQIRLVDEPFDLNGGSLQMMYPHDPAAPAGEVINCGCVAVPVVPGWQSKVVRPIDNRDTGTPLAQVRQPTAFDIARNGGAHAGWMKTQSTLPTPMLERGIRTLERRQAEHRAWIADPTTKMQNWDQLRPSHQAALVSGWKDDIERQGEHADILRGLIAERQKNG